MVRGLINGPGSDEIPVPPDLTGQASGTSPAPVTGATQVTSDPPAPGRRFPVPLRVWERSVGEVVPVHVLGQRAPAVRRAEPAMHGEHVVVAGTTVTQGPS
jgi:hypothetical protein